MSIYKRGSKFVVQVYDPAVKRSRQIGTFSSERDAKRAEAAAMTAARSAGTGAETVAQFAARWLTDFPRLRASTRMHNEERISRFVEEHGRRRLDTITNADARQWTLAHRSTLPAIRAMFNDARSVGLVTVNPFAGLKLSGPRARRDLPSEWLTADEVADLASAARDVHGEYGDIMAALVTFAAYTGVRPGELFALEWADLNGSTLHIHRAADSKTRTIGPPKNGRGRDVVLPHQARDAIDAMPRWEGQQTVFVAPRGGRIWGPHFSWLWAPVRAAFGRPTMHFYELRHFCATHLLELGLSAADVAVQLGHTDNGKLVLSTYGHPSERAARARILAALDGHGEGDVAAMKRRRSA